MAQSAPGHKRQARALVAVQLQSGAEATAVQTLARLPMALPESRQRLDCGAFTAALARPAPAGILALSTRNTRQP